MGQGIRMMRSMGRKERVMVREDGAWVGRTELWGGRMAKDRKNRTWLDRGYMKHGKNKWQKK